MQIADTFPKGAFPPRGDAHDISSQLQQQRSEHQRILIQRAMRRWWPYILLIALGGIAAGIAGQFVLAYPVYVFAPIVALVIFFLIAWRVDLGLIIVAVCSTPFLPLAFSLKSLSVYPALPLLIWLFFVLLVQVAFRVRKPVLPSFWSIWPLLGLVSLAFVSDIMAQITWTPAVPHKINNTPIIFDEIYGLALFFLPLILIVVTTTCLTKKEQWIKIIQRTFMVLAIILALIIFIEFKRIGATIYTFRFTDPKLFWMPLKAVAQVLCLGAIFGYVHFLYATHWRRRILYGGVVVICLLAVYLTLQNGWWLVVGIAFIVMTIVYSRRLFLFYCVLGLPFLPLVKAELAKLAVVKSADFYRLLIWQDALRVWSKQPFLGVGPGNYWAYDQRFTQLPKFLRDFNRTGLGVAHNGYLQTLGELGPLGVFFYLSFIIVIIAVAARLYRRSKTPKKPGTGIAKLLDLNLFCESETRSDRMLGLIGIGLTCGLAVSDFASGGFFLQPRQVGGSADLVRIFITWIIWGSLIYKDQLWRMARRGSRIER